MGDFLHPKLPNWFFLTFFPRRSQCHVELFFFISHMTDCSWPHRRRGILRVPFRSAGPRVRNFSLFITFKSLTLHTILQCVLINQSINHAVNQSINHAINQSINQSINQWLDQWISRLNNQSINQSIVVYLCIAADLHVELLFTCSPRSSRRFLDCPWLSITALLN